ncbi:MAG: DUF924 domain-containing protein [Alphaproteobacteria bacterium]|nr:DUF924 domain-containing protein [Alphaproteobacteria bacterium]
MSPTDPNAILDFWFLPPGDPGHGKPRKAWFEKSDAFDEEIRDRFGDAVAAAVDGAYDDWRETPKGTLALLLLLDQFTRNIYRGKAEAFAGDARALAIAQDAVSQGQDMALPPVMRKFFYLPFEHCEDIEVCRGIGPKFEALNAFEETKEDHRYWVLHLDVLEEFGRYPHRNAALGRPSTEAEAAWLAKPGSGF